MSEADRRRPRPSCERDDQVDELYVTRCTMCAQLIRPADFVPVEVRGTKRRLPFHRACYRSYIYLDFIEAVDG